MDPDFREVKDRYLADVAMDMFEKESLSFWKKVYGEALSSADGLEAFKSAARHALEREIARLSQYTAEIEISTAPQARKCAQCKEEIARREKCGTIQMYSAKKYFCLDCSVLVAFAQLKVMLEAAERKRKLLEALRRLQNAQSDAKESGRERA